MALGVLFTPLSGAQEPQNISVVLIIDNSGSMGGTDPADLRFVAASQLVDLLEDGDEISVVLFADDSTVLVPLTKVTDAASRDALKAQLVPVAPAANTHMRAGLEAGLAELEKASNPIRFGIFLTDGELHPPPWDDLTAEEQEAERSAVFALADAFGAKEWGLFPVSLASATEPEFLQKLAENGGGLYREAPEAGQLTLVFQEIFAAKKLDIFEILFSDCLAAGDQRSVTLPIRQFVSALSLFVTYPSELRPTVTVAGPDGTSLVPTGGDARYDAFSIENPAPGTWTVAIAGAAEGESCVSISSTPRTLVDVEWLQPPASLSLASGGPLEIVVRLTGRDPQTGEETLVEDATVTATVAGPEGQSYEVTLEHAGSGEYAGTVAVDGVEGTYTINLVAKREEAAIAQRSFETSVSLAPAGAPSSSPSPALTPSPGPPGAQPEGDGGPSLVVILLGLIVLVGLGGSFLAYSHFGRPVLRGWLESTQVGRAYDLESRHRRVWTRRALAIGGSKDDIDVGLGRRLARIIPRRGGHCFLQAVAEKGVVVDGHPLRRGQSRRLRHHSEIKLGEVALIYRLYVGGPRTGV